MKVLVNCEMFQEVIKKAIKLIPTKGYVETLKNMLVFTQDNKIKCRVTDLESILEFELYGNIIEEGKLLIELDTLKLLGKLKKVKQLQISENNIIADNKTIQYINYDISEFPDFLPECNVSGFNTTEKELLELLSVSYCSSLDENRPIFNSVFIDESHIVATDTHRLASKEFKFENNLTKGINIPLKDIKLLNSFLNKKSELNVKLFVSEDYKYTKFEFDNCSYIIRLLEGTFPNWKQVMPSNNKTSININTEKLLEELSFIEGIAKTKDESKVITLAIIENKLYIDASNNKNSVTLEIDLENKYGEDMECLGINYNYLIDALKHSNNKENTLEFNGSLSPVVLNSNTLILPIRVETRKNNKAA